MKDTEFDAMESSLERFDPEAHRSNVYDAFSEFVETYKYEYEAVAKEPPESITEEADRTKWIEINMRKLFLGRYCSRNFQKDYEAAVPLAERTSLTFTQMVTKMKKRYEPSRNYTLANFEFHGLRQEVDGESFDNFAHRVRAQSQQCQFSCGETCTVPDIMIRDQLIIGTNNSSIRENALREQWSLKDLIENGRKMESASHCNQRIKEDNQGAFVVNRTNSQGRSYSRKKQSRSETKMAGPSGSGSCTTCSSRFCKGGKKCKAFGATCHECHKMGHFRGSRACPRRKNKTTRRVEPSSEEESTDSENDL